MHKAKKFTFLFIFSFFLFPSLILSQIIFPVTASASEEMVDFSLYNIHGEPITLSSVKGEDPALLVFWSMWSEESWEILSQLKSLRTQYENHGVRVITVNVDRNPRNLSAFLNENRYRFTVLKDPMGIFEDRYQVYFLPTNILIDKDNVIVYREKSLPEIPSLAALI